MFELYVWKREIRGIFWKFHFGGGIYLGHGASHKLEISETKNVHVFMHTVHCILLDTRILLERPTHCMELASISVHPHSFPTKLIHKIL